MTPCNRRRFLGGVAVSAVAATGGTQVIAEAGPDTFQLEITRSEAEWRARLTEEEFRILREGGTEAKFSSPHVTENREGLYTCKGCDLPIYDGLWKVPLEIGWVFFRHARPRSVLTGIDGEPFIGGEDQREAVAIEVHCRRCASHLGHIVHAEGQLVHCINGASLIFTKAAA